MRYSGLTLLWIAFLALGLFLAFLVHGWAQAWAARRLGDPAPAMDGRLSLDIRRHADPFGTWILPGLLLILAAAGMAVPPFAYGRPMPFRSRDRRRLALSVAAGPAANLALAVVGAGFAHTVPGAALLVANVSMFAFNLIPLPPFDASLVLARFLPPQAADFMDRAQPYGAIVVLVVFFLLPGPVLSIVETLGSGICRVLVGAPCL